MSLTAVLHRLQALRVLRLPDLFGRQVLEFGGLTRFNLVGETLDDYREPYPSESAMPVHVVVSLAVSLAQY